MLRSKRTTNSEWTCLHLLNTFCFRRTCIPQSSSTQKSFWKWYWCPQFSGGLESLTVVWEKPRSSALSNLSNRNSLMMISCMRILIKCLRCWRTPWKTTGTTICVSQLWYSWSTFWLWFRRSLSMNSTGKFTQSCLRDLMMLRMVLGSRTAKS